MGADGFGVGALQCGGEGLDAVVVGGGLFLWCGEGGGELRLPEDRLLGAGQLQVPAGVQQCLLCV